MSRQGAMPLSPSRPDAWAAAPFDARLADEARRLVERLDGPQRLWLSGYLAGSIPSVTAAPSQQRSEHAPVIVLFGSQSGNAERVAKEAADVLRQRGIASVALDMIDCGKAELAGAETLLVVISTQGDGDPPDRAIALWELLAGRKAPRLEQVHYAVLGLGDSSYEKYCETGRRFDQRLEELGAHRLHDRVDCDVDFEEPARAWTQAIVDKLAARVGSAAVELETNAPAPVPVVNAYTRKNPFLAEVLLNQRLTASGSSKDVRHIELSLSGSHIRYEPGDAIGIVARNCDAAVEELLETLPFDAETPLSLEPGEISLRDALAGRFDIGLVSPAFLQRYVEAVQLRELADPGNDHHEERLRELSHGRDLVDIVRQFPPENLDAAAFAGLLRPLAPRLYSIASSLHASPDEAHLTVSIARHETRGKLRQGVASGMLASLTSDQARVPVYLHRNTGFRLPGPEVPIVMIGPGTGVAPFRAFVAERAALGAQGRNWLFFGDRRFETDFLYQSEWLAWRRQGVLTRLEVAFSRDQSEKIYVQHRLRHCGAELWTWLAEGAHLYVCGDAAGMAPAVHEALIDIVRCHGGQPEDQAREYLVDLQRQRRYQRDIY